MQKIQGHFRGFLSRKNKIDFRQLKKISQNIQNQEEVLLSLNLKSRTFARSSLNLILFQQLLSKHDLYFFKKKQNLSSKENRLKQKIKSDFQRLNPRPQTAQKLSNLVEKMALKK